MDSKETTKSTIRFAARDGRPLEGDLYEPTGPARASVIVHGATAVPRRHYDAFARHLQELGFRVMTYDYRGVGGSTAGHPRSDRATMTDWLEHDAPAAVRTLTLRDPTLPLLVVGHSFGGQVAAGLDGVARPLAIVTTGAQRGYWAEFAWQSRPKMFLNWYVLLPLVSTVLGYVPGAAGLGVDMPSGVVEEWAKWCRSPDYFLGDHPELGVRIGRYEGHLLSLSATDDDYASLSNVEWLIDLHARAKREHRRFTPHDAGVRAFGHFGFFKKQAATTVWPEITSYFDEVLGDGSRLGRLGTSLPVTSAPAPLDEAGLAADLAHGRS